MKNTVCCFGDSLTVGWQLKPYTEILEELITDGKKVVNMGIGAEKSYQIGYRQGGIPVYVKPFTIPADKTEVEILMYDNLGNDVNTVGTQGPNGINPVTIAGVVGEYRLDQVEHKCYFKRIESGDEINVSRPTRVFFDGNKYKDTTLVLWCGSNNRPDMTEIENVIRDQRNMITHNGNDRYIIIGLTSLTYIPDIINVNRRLAREYGEHFIDLLSYMREYALEDSGITPTAEDLKCIAAGDAPNSLRSDAIHGNQYFYNVVAKCVYNKGVELGYWK